MEHYDIDELVEYGSQEIPGTTEVVNPAWRSLDKAVRSNLCKPRAELHHDIKQLEADTDELRFQRRKTKRKVCIDTLPEDQRPRELLPIPKLLANTDKVIG